MIGRLRGILAYKSPPWLVIDVGGVGYELEAPMSTFYDLRRRREVLLFTHYAQKEDSVSLYGFLREGERRLFRDGGSAYLINGKKARLRDIRELFLDTGIGADAYSIIEQGKVDAMLLASPQDAGRCLRRPRGLRSTSSGGSRRSASSSGQR